MKFAITFLTLIAVSVVAQDSNGAQAPDTSLIYIKMSASPYKEVGPTPGTGIGYRFGSGSSAVDFSANFQGCDRKDATVITYTFPKANYFHYFNPTGKNSFYAGGGLAWGGVYKKYHHEDDSCDKTDFNGIIANVAVGFELQRFHACRSFIQLDVSQATLAISRRHHFPGPAAELSVGIGF